jgi:hypothetical protein
MMNEPNFETQPDTLSVANHWVQRPLSNRRLQRRLRRCLNPPDRFRRALISRAAVAC